MGAAAMFATSLAVLVEAFPERKERNGAFAAYGATIGGAFALGPLLGGLLTASVGWRSIFFVNLPLGLLCLIGTVRLRESKNPEPRRIDWIGQALLVGGLFLWVLGLPRGNAAGWSSPQIIAELVTATFLLAAFVAVEHQRREPMLPLRMFRDPRLLERKSPLSRCRHRSSPSSYTSSCTSRRSCTCPRSGPA